MRMALVAAVMAMAMAGGCAVEKQRAEHEEKISAARLSGKFRRDDPLVLMLSPSEKAALARADMLEAPPEGEEALADGEAADDPAGAADPDQKTQMEKAGEAMLSVLAVSVSLGMAAAPFLLF